MAWYLNTYECSECGGVWEDEWSCMCDDECPNCGASDHSPIDSEDISAFIEKDEDGLLTVYYSPPEAGHSPDYRIFANVANANLAKLLLKVALDLARPA